MGFLEEVKGESLKIKNVSVLPLIENTLGKKEFAEFVTAVNDPTIPCSAIVRVLKKKGVSVSENTIRKYRSENVVK